MNDALFYVDTFARRQGHYYVEAELIDPADAESRA